MGAFLMAHVRAPFLLKFFLHIFHALLGSLCCSSPCPLSPTEYTLPHILGPSSPKISPTAQWSQQEDFSRTVVIKGREQLHCGHHSKCFAAQCGSQLTENSCTVDTTDGEKLHCGHNMRSSASKWSQHEEFSCTEVIKGREQLHNCHKGKRTAAQWS